MCPLFLIRLSLFLMCMFIDDSNDVMIICNLLRNMMVEVTSYLVTTTERLHVVLLIRFCCTIDLLVWSSIAKSLNDDCSSLNDGPPGCSGATIFDTLIEQTFHPFCLPLFASRSNSCLKVDVTAQDIQRAPMWSNWAFMFPLVSRWPFHTRREFLSSKLANFRKWIIFHVAN